MENPVKDLMELNAKTLQRFTYLVPAELLLSKKPEDMVEKNIKLFWENSHTALEYMQKMFGIVEKHLLQNADKLSSRSSKESSTHSTKQAASNATKQASSSSTKKTAAKKTIKKAIKASSSKASPAKKASPSKSKPKISSASTKKITASKSVGIKKSAPKKASSSIKSPVKKASPVISKESMKPIAKPQTLTHEIKKPASMTPSHFTTTPGIKPMGPQNSHK
jgi:transcription-repair coupling factor (superfamily II helicase)